MSFAWTDARIETLKQMCVEHASYGEIGRALGCSRNAAIGKAARMGISNGNHTGTRYGRPRYGAPRASSLEMIARRAAEASRGRSRGAPPGCIRTSIAAHSVSRNRAGSMPLHRWGCSRRCDLLRTSGPATDAVVPIPFRPLLQSRRYRNRQKCCPRRRSRAQIPFGGGGVSVTILHGDVRDMLRILPADHFDCVVTSPPYWGLRPYLPDDHADKPREIGCERTLGEHIAVLVDVFEEVRRVIKPRAAVWLNYGDCYATSPNGRSAADTKAAGNDDRTFRDKPFSTIGPIYVSDPRTPDRRGNHSTLAGAPPPYTPGRIAAGGYLKPKDLCLIPFRLVIALQEAGWWVRSRCIWGKPNGMPDSSGKYRPSVAHEEIFLLSKSGDLDYDSDAVSAPVSDSTHARVSQNVAVQNGSARANGGRKTNGNMKAVVKKQDGHGRRHAGFNERYFGEPGVTPKSAPEDSNIRSKGSFNASTTEILPTRYLRTYEPEVWHMATAAFSGAHYATFPPALVERCLMASCKSGAHVLDPFGGAGTVGLVADRMGYDATLIELNPESIEIARNRINRDAPLFAQVSA